jgi:hypothetical protein
MARAPGAKRVELSGIAAAPDRFGRIRVILQDTKDGKRDQSWLILRRDVVCPGGDVPYELKDPPDSEDRGSFWMVPPARHKKHWLGAAEDLRGRWVKVEAVLRPYNIPGRPGREARRGISLDLAMLEPLA